MYTHVGLYGLGLRILYILYFTLLSLDMVPVEVLLTKPTRFIMIKYNIFVLLRDFVYCHNSSSYESEVVPFDFVNF